jgi:methylmalonyl-CoA/ethylmalonyl-CoA epimerase
MKKLHHVGILVPNLESWGEAYATSLELKPESEIVHDPIQKVRVQFWRDDAAKLVELIEPAAPDSPAWGELKKGGGLNHLCYEVDDIEKHVEHAVTGGAILAVSPVPAAAFSGRRIAFLYFRKLGLIEFVETEAQP